MIKIIEHISPDGIYYRTNELKADRQTLFFIHGLSGSSSAWRKFETEFGTNWNVVCLDLRNHGKSRKFHKSGDLNPAAMANDVISIADSLGLKKLILVCHSFGTLIGFELLKHYQDRFLAVVLLAPSSNVTSRKLAKMSAPFIKAMAWGAKLLPFSGRPGNHIDYSKFPMSGDWNLPRMYADIRNTGLRGYLFGSAESLKQNYDGLLSAIQIPVLIIHGTDDTVFPVSESKRICALIPNCSLKLLPSTNHILVLNNFPEISFAIKNFLRDNIRS